VAKLAAMVAPSLVAAAIFIGAPPLACRLWQMANGRWPVAVGGL